MEGEVKYNAIIVLATRSEFLNESYADPARRVASHFDFDVLREFPTPVILDQARERAALNGKR